MSQYRKPVPKNQSQITQETVTPYLPNQGKPISDSISQRHQNRALQTSRNTDKVKDISISLQDIDYAIKYYFDTVIKPVVVQDGNKVEVPVKYSSPERWKSVQADGYYRDTNGKLVLPIIIYKRESVEKNRTLGNKIDGNLAALFQVFQTKYNSKNQYDKFSILNGVTPSKQYYVSVVPDYVTITYSVSIFTNYVEQNNKIIEAIEFAADSYWGDENRWHFRTSLDSFATTNIINTGEDRAAVTTVTLKVNGYLIPDSVNKQLADSHLHYSPSQIIFGTEVVGNANEVFAAKSQIAASQKGGQTSFVGGGTNITNQNISLGGAGQADINYANANVTKLANTVTSNTATFTGAIWLEPSAESGLPSTSVNNFTFMANGLGIPLYCITSFIQSNGNSILTVDPNLLGYYLTDKEIAATGKFS